MAEIALDECPGGDNEELPAVDINKTTGILFSMLMYDEHSLFDTNEIQLQATPDALAFLIELNQLPDLYNLRLIAFSR
ncbi:hypothetical protein CHS0354_022668, partial [Potamilus streckersoni]